jgi:uncharacterized phage protein (TIGR01671 family)
MSRMMRMMTMREILFRGKRRDNGEWLYGSLMQITYKEENNAMPFYIIFEDFFIFVGGDAKSLRHAVVDPETVGQYTMMSDDHLKRLFEGDICRAKNLLHNGKEELFTVEWCENGFFLVDDTGTTWHPCYLEDIENIGNIHDNPELLGGANA